MDILSAIRSSRSDQAAQDKELRSLFLRLQEQIVDQLSGAELRVQSKTVVFEEGGDDDAIYGHLHFGDGALSAAYRTREEDFDDARNGESYDSTYTLRAIPDCPIRWLTVLAQEPVLNTFQEAILADLARRRTEANAGITALRTALKAPVRDAEAAFEDAAKRLGYNDVIADWRRAQTSLSTDPAVAITLASSLIESVLTHILTTRGVPIPDKKEIQALLKPTLRALSLSEDDLPDDDLKNISRGIVNVVQSLGALRTHGSAAHGRGPGNLTAGPSEARFAVDLAGALATFLMEATYRR